MVLVGLLSLLLPSVAGGASGVDPRGAATGLGSALVFWVGVLSLVISARLGPTFDPTEPKGRFGGVWRPPIPPTAS